MQCVVLKSLGDSGLAKEALKVDKKMSSCSIERTLRREPESRGTYRRLDEAGTVAGAADRSQLSATPRGGQERKSGERVVFDENRQAWMAWTCWHVIDKRRNVCHFGHLTSIPSRDALLFFLRFEGDPDSPFHWRSMTILIATGVISAMIRVH